MFKKRRNRKDVSEQQCRRCKSGCSLSFLALDFLRIYGKHFSRLVKGSKIPARHSPLKRHKSNFFIYPRPIQLSDRLYRYISPFGGFAIVFAITPKSRGDLNRLTLKNEHSHGTYQTLLYLRYFMLGDDAQCLEISSNGLIFQE